MIHGHNLSSTSGGPEFDERYFFEIPASVLFFSEIPPPNDSNLRKLEQKNLFDGFKQKKIVIYVP
jgi:hypothetical protein